MHECICDLLPWNLHAGPDSYRQAPLVSQIEKEVTNVRRKQSSQENLLQEASLVLPNGQMYPITRIDQGRDQNKLSLFSPLFGSYTPPFDDQTKEWIVVSNLVMEESTNLERGTPIPRNGYVLSASGQAKVDLESLRPGDSIQPVHLNIPVFPSKYAKIKEEIIRIDGINRIRGLNEVIVYLTSYGKTTQTNEWGMELIVEKGKITAICLPGNPNNSVIPKDGFVLSIHSDSPYISALAHVEVGDEAQLFVQEHMVYSAAKLKADAYNPKKKEDNPAGWDHTSNTPYPGMRGAEQLIVYDANYGETTGTNPWGIEAVINEEGKVISCGGNNTSIPTKGLVLSGHGTKADWLMKHAVTGAEVIWKKESREVVILFMPKSYLDRGRIKIEELNEQISESRRKFLDVPYTDLDHWLSEARHLYSKAEEQIKDQGQESAADLLKQLDQTVHDTAYRNVESRTVEERALWLRPKELDREQVRQAVRKIKKAGFTSIYLETFWDGYTIYPTKNKITRHNPIYNGFDVLEAYIREGKKAKIEIHAWVENFFVGGNEPGPVLTAKPEWALISRQGKTYQEDPASGYRYYFINPALTETHDFISDVYKELLTQYKVDGLHLDYARYANSGDFTNDFGYDPYTRKLFADKFGVDPIRLHPGDTLWSKWVDLRVGFIDHFVNRIVKEAKALKPSIHISAAVWPEYAKAREDVLQDSMGWVRSNWIDNVFPMSYKPDTSLVVADAKETLDHAQHNAMVTIGVGSFTNLPKDVFIDQINSCNQLGVSGSGIFEYESFFQNGYDHELRLGLYRNKALIPMRNAADSICRLLEEGIRKIKRIYVPFGGMTESKMYQRQMDTIRQILKHGQLNHGKLLTVGQKLDHLVQQIRGDNQIKEEV